MNRILKNKSLKITGIYLFANIVNKAIAFITIPIFSRMLTTEEYGIVSTYSSYVLILQYIMGLSSEYTLRNAYVDYNKEIPAYMSSMFTLTLLNSSLISICVIVVNIFSIHVADTWLCVCCLLQSFMTFVNNAMINKLMMDNDYISRSILTAVPNILSALFGVIFILLISENRVMGRILGYVVALSMFGIYNIGSSWIHAKPQIFSKYWKYILKISPPLVVHGLSMIALSQLDRIMITSLKSSSETGIYSIIYSLSMVALAVTQAIEGVWIPWFTKKYTNKEYGEINKRARQYLLLIAVLVSVIMLIAPETLKIMAPKAYWGGIPMIPPLILSSYFIYMYSYYVGVELYQKRTKTISMLTLIATVSNIWLNTIFIPKYGGLAAAFTTLISYILLFLLHLIVGRKINRNTFPIKCFLGPLTIVIITMAFFYIVMDWFIIRWILSVGIMVVYGVFFYKNKILNSWD